MQYLSLPCFLSSQTVWSDNFIILRPLHKTPREFAGLVPGKAVWCCLPSIQGMHLMQRTTAVRPTGMDGLPGQPDARSRARRASRASCPTRARCGTTPPSGYQSRHCPPVAAKAGKPHQRSSWVHDNETVPRLFLWSIADEPPAGKEARSSRHCHKIAARLMAPFPGRNPATSA